MHHHCRWAGNSKRINAFCQPTLFVSNIIRLALAPLRPCLKLYRFLIERRGMDGDEIVAGNQQCDALSCSLFTEI